MKQGIRKFYAYARARHECYLKKQSDPGWITSDPILAKYRFTNVFRELDKTTVWFRKYVREPLRDNPNVLMATVVFRMFNRILTGESLFLQTFMTDEGDVRTAFDKFLIDGNVKHLRSAIKTYCKKGPYVTGAYIISSPPDYSKLDGVCEVLKRFYKNSGWQHWLDNDPIGNECSLQAAWEWLREQDYFGNFHSYEIVTDLRHTALLENAPDIMTWANPGPGCKRGLNRVMGREKDTNTSREQMLEEMLSVLGYAKNEELWPRKWPKWEMRDVEHTLCEFDKYERVRNGEGRPRGVYR
jgi:hypothetical protein